MKTYEVNMMIQKPGKDPARVGILEVTAETEQEALDIATDIGKDHYKNACATAGIRPNETTRIWAELAKNSAID